MLEEGFANEPKRLERRYRKHTSQPYPAKTISARLEPATYATITYDAIPRLYQPANDNDGEDAASQLACSVSGGTMSSTPSLYDDGSQSSAPIYENSHTRVGSKKVDFVVALDLPEDDPLALVLRELTQVEITQPPFPPLHTSQTSFHPVKDQLLPIAIETKRSVPASDPLDQVQIWTAAFHRRMEKLRSIRGIRLLNRTAQQQQQQQREDEKEKEQGSRKLLPTLPLLIVTGSQWKLYYAIDRGDHIDLSSPCVLGSTDSIMDVYVLLACLKALRQWVETVFYDSMRDYFVI